MIVPFQIKIVGALIVLACCLPLGNAVCGQDEIADSQQRNASDTTTGAGSSILPLPFVFYTPETKAGLGGTVLTLFRLSNGGALEPPSRISPIFIFTQKKQIVAILGTELFFGAGRYRGNASLGYSRFPNKIWGIGNDTPDDLEEDYTSRVIFAKAEFQRRVASGWYVGGRVEFAHRELIETDSLGLLAARALPGTDDGEVLSWGALLTWDTRDNTVYPKRGGYRLFSTMVSDSSAISDYGFAAFTLDLRHYLSPTPGHVIAIRGVGMASSGIRPFDLMPQLGGENLVRGYYAGRFRDRNLVAFQVEYRAHVWRRLGAIGFASAGRVAHALSDLDLSGFKPAVGFGLRFLLAPDEGLNVRADFGVGKGSLGFYLGMGEVF